jgi:hypothetical protein
MMNAIFDDEAVHRRFRTGSSREMFPNSARYHGPADLRGGLRNRRARRASSARRGAVRSRASLREETIAAAATFTQFIARRA